MNTSVTPPALIIPLTTGIPQLAENGPLLSKAWTWHPYHPESAPGMMGQEPLSTEKWKPQGVLLRIEEAKVSEASDFSSGSTDATALPRRLQGSWEASSPGQPHPSVCLFCLSPTGVLGVLSPLYPPGLRLCKGTCSQLRYSQWELSLGDCKLSL